MDNERPLTSAGSVAAAQLATHLGNEPVTAVYSSPYRRAVETVQPIASVHGLPVQVLEDLRERRLSGSSLAEPAFLEALHRARSDPAFALPGGESTDDVRDRALRALTEIRRQTPKGTAVAGTHGGVISILRWHLGEAFTVEEALAEPMPATYRIAWKGGDWRIGSAG